jgi:hypothetical protein
MSQSHNRPHQTSYRAKGPHQQSHVLCTPGRWTAFAPRPPRYPGIIKPIVPKRRLVHSANPKHARILVYASASARLTLGIFITLYGLCATNIDVTSLLQYVLRLYLVSCRFESSRPALNGRVCGVDSEARRVTRDASLCF